MKNVTFKTVMNFHKTIFNVKITVRVCVKTVSNDKMYINKGLSNLFSFYSASDPPSTLGQVARGCFTGTTYGDPVRLGSLTGSLCVAGSPHSNTSHVSIGHPHTV